MNDTSTLKILGEDNDFVYLDIPKVFGVLKWIVVVNVTANFMS